jgi:hypothetical protein
MDPPLARNALVNENLAVSGESGALRFDDLADRVSLRILLLNPAHGVTLGFAVSDGSLRQDIVNRDVGGQRSEGGGQPASRKAATQAGEVRGQESHPCRKLCREPCRPLAVRRVLIPDSRFSVFRASSVQSPASALRPSPLAVPASGSLFPPSVVQEKCLANLSWRPPHHGQIVP